MTRARDLLKGLFWLGVYGALITVAAVLGHGR